MVINSPCVSADRGATRFRKRFIKIRKKMLRTTFQNSEIVVGCPECQTHSTSITQKTLGGIKKIAISIARHVTPIPRCWSCLSKFCSIFTFFTAVGYQPSAIGGLLVIEYASYRNSTFLYSVVPKAERLQCNRPEC